LLIGTRDLSENQKMLLFRKVLISLGLLVVAGVAQAAPIILNGDHFTVSYDDAQAGIYGQGLLSGSGDALFFTPTQFKTSSGSGPASVSSALTLTFTIDSGYAFTGLSYSESGDYFLLGGAVVDVAASVNAVNAATLASSSLALSPGAALDDVTSFANFRTTDWLLSGNLSLLGLGGPNILQITLDNTLYASTPNAGYGFIEKKFVGLSIVTEPALPPVSVPEPTSGALLLVGMMAALLVGRRRVVHASETGQSL
jgi:hypothetical protein